MASVRFNLRPNSNKDPLIQLIYRLDADRSKLVMSTKLHVPTKYWNKSTMRVRETTEFIEYNAYNGILDRWENAVKDTKNKYFLLGITPTKAQFKKDVITTVRGEDTHKPKRSFPKYFNDFIQLKEKGKTTGSTIKQYNNALTHVVKYNTNQRHGAALDFPDMDINFFLDFIRYLKKTKADNTIHKIIKKIRTVIKDAEVNGIEVNLDYKKPDSQVSYIKQPKFYLSTNEIEQIKAHELTPLSRLDKVRDLFLIGVHTGLRFSDLIRLSSEHITNAEGGKQIIKMKIKKTQSFVTIPLQSSVNKILEKYDGFPPNISEPKFNLYLKELCKNAKINKPVFRDEGGVQKRYEKHELVSSHVCRRSFATNSFLSGVPPNVAMSFTGHSSIKQFMEYICIDEEETLQHAGTYSFFD